MPDKGISVLIPVYNCDVSALVTALYTQFCAVVDSIPAFKFELRIYDDCSTEKQIVANNESLPGIIYKKLPQNLGRSKIRNLLAREAVYQNLLFLDCDNLIVSPRYISTYATLIADYEIISGGTSYTLYPPENRDWYLHWLAGKHKEESKAAIRQQNPYSSFTLNNMLIKKDIYMSVPLDETIITYGHEDSKFGELLGLRKHKLVHIDNPVCHIGLNENKVFIEKSMQAVDNLAKMIAADGIGTHTKLFKAYCLLKRWRMIGIASWLIARFEKTLLSNLLSDNPSLMFFDLLKLKRFITSYNK